MRKENKRTRQSIVLVFFLIFGQIASAQKLFQVVSVDIKQQRLEDALATISKKGDFYFSYSSNFIPNDSVVSVSANNHTVKEVLDLLLNEKYEYKETYNYIILRPAPFRLRLIPEEVLDKDNSYTVAGYVEDERTGAKIMQASVYEKRLLSSTLTDRRGYFKLRLSKKESEIALTVSKELYRDVTMVLLPSAVVLPGNADKYAKEEDMGKVERTAMGKLFISSKQRIQSLNLSGFFTNSPFQASLTPGLGTHGIFNSQVINKFSLNLAGGYTTGVRGLEIAGGFNINKGDVGYVQVAGTFNVVGGSVKGVQLAGVNNTILGDSVKGVEVAGVYNDVRGDFLGVQIGGAANFSKKDIKYVQIAGAINHVGGTFEGVQIAGAINMVKDSITGIQISGLLNQTDGSLSGVQLTGAFNRVRKEMTGLQLSGAVNIAGKAFKGLQLTGVGNISSAKIHGAQVSSVFNYARKLEGFQLGIVNIADSSSGVSLGLLNIIKNGYHKVSISYNEVTNTNIAFKSGNAKLYTIYLGGINISDRKKAYSAGLGFGHDFILNKKLLISAELTSSMVYVGNWNQLNVLARAKATLNFELSKGLSIFAGPAFNVYTDNTIERVEGYKNITASNKHAFSYGREQKSWVGFEAGITFF